jgi:hypothetical protein
MALKFKSGPLFPGLDGLDRKDREVKLSMWRPIRFGFFAMWTGIARPLGAVTLVLGLLAAVPAQASTYLYDNLDNAAPHSGVRFAPSSTGLYASFSTTDAVDLLQVRLVLTASIPSDGGTAEIDLFANPTTPGAIAPGALVAEIGTIDDSSLTSAYLSATPLEFDLAVPVSLDANRRYWIGILPDLSSSIQWVQTNTDSGTGVDGEYSYWYVSNPHATANNSSPPLLMSVLATPLPGALPLFVSGIFLLGFFVYRRKLTPA